MKMLYNILQANYIEVQLLFLTNTIFVNIAGFSNFKRCLFIFLLFIKVHAYWSLKVLTINAYLLEPFILLWVAILANKKINTFFVSVSPKISNIFKTSHNSFFYFWNKNVRCIFFQLVTLLIPVVQQILWVSKHLKLHANSSSGSA